MENEESKQEQANETPKPEAVHDPREVEVAALKERLSQTLNAYRESLIRLNPELPAEMVGGDTLQAVNESISQARALVSKVKQSLEAEKAAGRVPAGSPARTEADNSNLSSREKIQLGIGGK
ncbi:MAG: hypothetical protein C4542_00210 [Dehalococcoidia bacterium]|nr:MAG: hypothetical protein C4542_00210 [Dehalococcoidia bacterium]